MPKRIWVLTNEFEPYIIGGLGIAVTDLVSELVRKGVHITVLSRAQGTNVRVKSSRTLQIVFVPHTNAFYTSSIQQIRPEAIVPLFKAKGISLPHIIHVHSPQYIEIAEHFKKNYRVPIVYTCHSLVALEDVRRSPHLMRSERMQVQLFHIARRIVVPSTWEKQMIEKLYPQYAKKVAVIPHGVPYQPKISRGPKHSLLFIGRIVPVKGIDHLLQAVVQLKKYGYPVRLDIIGDGSRGYFNKLHTFARQHNIAQHVRWLGYLPQEQIQRMYTNYGAVIMPSHHESFGLVALEALASGIPLVCTQNGGLSEFIDASVAQIIPRTRGTDIANAIITMWSNESRTQQRIVNGRALAATYRWPAIADHYIDMFALLLASKGGSHSNAAKR